MRFGRKIKGSIRIGPYAFKQVDKSQYLGSTITNHGRRGRRLLLHLSPDILPSAVEGTFRGKFAAVAVIFVVNTLNNSKDACHISRRNVRRQKDKKTSITSIQPQLKRHFKNRAFYYYTKFIQSKTLTKRTKSEIYKLNTIVIIMYAGKTMKLTQKDESSLLRLYEKLQRR